MIYARPSESADMTKWRLAYNEAESKKKTYEDYKGKVENLSTAVSSSKSTLENAEGAFSQGGYNDGTNSVCPEGFSTCYSNLGDAVSLLDGAVQKLQTKIGEIETEMQTCKTNYNNAVIANDRAKNVSISAA